MDPPIGWIPLRAAADMVGRKLHESTWWSLNVIFRKNHPDVERVFRLLAEACEGGEIAAAYRTLAGADVLDCAVWRSPCWRNYFATGTIDLDLPRLDAKDQPDTSVPPVRCTREIFVRRQDLDRFVAGLSKASVNRPSAVRASQKQIAGIVTRYRNSLAADATPLIPDLEAFAKREGLFGHRPELRAEYHKQFPNQRVGRPLASK
jgi:hypothetical protein